MTSHRLSRHRPFRRPLTLRPRAGLAATALLVAGLAGSGAVALFGDFVEPARAQTAASRIDQPTPATMPDTTDGATGHAAAGHPLKPSTDVMATGGSGERVNPEDHLSESAKPAR